jgi:N-acetylglucosaminyl-diphospho-decaprenol L-rhamnosyltransferase
VPPLFVSYSAAWGGAERALLDVAAHLDTPALLACPTGRLAERAREAGIDVFPLRPRSLELRRSARDRAGAPLRHAAQSAELRRLLHELEPEVVVAWGMRALLSAAPAAGRRRLVFAHHDLLPGPLIRHAVRAAARRADLVTASSRCIAEDLGLPARVIHPGVEIGDAAPARPTGPPTVLCLGALVPWKRLDLALDAAALAARELPELRLRLAGAAVGPGGEGLLAELHRRAERPDLAGRVDFAGALPGSRAALEGAACLLHCAEREPFGLVVAEALAVGVPAVVPDSCGPAEIVDESCGRLYPPGDARAAAAALVEVCSNGTLRVRLGAAGRERASRLFDVATTRETWRELLTPAEAPDGGRGRGLALVTVTHDSEPELRRLLDSVSRHLPGAALVVVDSGSSDGSAAIARAWPGGARVIELGENAGFGVASNRGVAAAEAPVTVLINPDARLVDGSLAGLASELARADRILAPVVIGPDGRRQEYQQRAPGSLASFARALVPLALLPARLAPWRARRSRPTDWAAGCCLAARTETLRRLGPFDERTFMYGEDLDLGLRAAAAGVETWVWPAARVAHEGGRSAERQFGGEPYDRLARQRRAVVAERLGSRRATLDDIAQALTFATRIAGKRLLGRPADRERRQLQALRKARAAP